ncbi:unnamed protein product, partial [Amoebophrya sp. A25]
ATLREQFAAAKNKEKDAGEIKKVITACAASISTGPEKLVDAEMGKTVEEHAKSGGDAKNNIQNRLTTATTTTNTLINAADHAGAPNSILGGVNDQGQTVQTFKLNPNAKPFQAVAGPLVYYVSGKNNAANNQVQAQNAG